MKSLYITTSAEAANANGDQKARYEMAVLSIARLVARHGASSQAASEANINTQPKENAS